MPEACQHFSNFFTKYKFRTRLRQPDGTDEKNARFWPPGEYQCYRPPAFPRIELCRSLSSGTASELPLLWRMRAPPFHGDNVVTIFAKATRRAELRESRGSAQFLNLLALCDRPFAQVRATDGQNLIESEQGCADALHLQPHLAEHGTSILLMTRPTGESAIPATVDHFSPTFAKATAWQADHQ
jgi:hypothetical protein